MFLEGNRAGMDLYLGIDVFIVVSEKVSGYVKSFETFETLRE